MRDGLRIELADLGDWASATLVAEYDPDGPVIRVNVRALPADPAARAAHIERAVAHELHHHAEALGTVPRGASRAAREAAADAASRGFAPPMEHDAS